MRSLLDITLSALGVKHTALYVKELERECPYRNSLWALVRMLDRFKVTHYSSRMADKSRIEELPCPFVAEVPGDCVVVTEVDSHQVSYTAVKGRLKENVDTFVDKWSGVCVLLQTDEASAEPDYKEHKRLQTIRMAENAAAAVSGVLIALSIAAFASPWMGWKLSSWLAVLSATGLVLSYWLLKLHLHAESKAAKKLCSLFGGQSSCSDTPFLVLGRYDLSELGLAFFGANLFFSLCAPWHLFPSLAVITLAVLPFTIWSILYQHRHKWCLLCLCVQGVVWAQSALFCFGEIFSSVRLAPWFFVTTVFVIAYYVFALYLVHRGCEHYLRSRQMNAQLEEAAKLKFSPQVWAAMNEPQKTRAASSGNSLLVFGGNGSDKPTLTILGNPLCSPCARMHHRLQPLIDAGFTVEYVFSYFMKDYEHLNRQIITSYIKEGAEQTWERLNRWYRNEPRPDKQFYEETSLSASEKETVGAELLRHERWVELTGIHSTPFVLINGRELPAHYQVEDLVYLY